jgi:DMSO/TMAO reductase YedYZ molybdopterin-dependent catalytic subunit
MKRHPILSGLLFGLFTVIPVIVVLYLGERFAGLPFVPFNLFDFMTRTLPGAVINPVLEFMVRVLHGLHVARIAAVAKAAEQAIGVVSLVIIGIVFGGVLAMWSRRSDFRSAPRWGLLTGLVLLALALPMQSYLGIRGSKLATSGIWLVILFGGWGLVLGWLLRESLRAVPEPSAAGVSRRDVLYLAGSAVMAVLASAVGLGFLFVRAAPATATAPTSTPIPPGGAPTSGQAASPPEATLEARIPPAPGTRPEVTSNADFYRIDIDTVVPRIDATSWRLMVGGTVDNPRAFTLDEIRSRPAISQYITLSCISNPIGGNLISTALVTGMRLKDLMQEVGLQTGSHALAVESIDGFFESVSIQHMMDDRTLLVYEMNGQPLPAAHGFPLRLYIPDLYGMKMPKWIVSINAIASDGSGYWEDRGWSKQAIVRTTSAIDNVAVGQPDPSTGNLPIGGIAYAGDRGISKVEVRIDSGPWVAVELRDPPLSTLTWVQWRYDWPPQPGNHVAAVRAYDGAGALQVVQSEGAYPDGAAGIDTFTFQV